MAISLGRLAEMVGGSVVGDAAVTITDAAPLAEVRAGEITLVDAPERLRDLHRRSPTAIVTSADVPPVDLATIIVDDVHCAFATIVEYFHPPRHSARSGINSSAFVSPTAKLAADVDVHAGASVGDDVSIGAGSTVHAGAHILPGCVIGAGVTIYPAAVLYENTRVGDRSIIHSGVVLGSFGFGYRQHQGRHVLSAQLGFVDVGADVEIGANTTIDRGTYGATVIGEGTKIDNLVQIAHNCRIGRHNMICSQVGIAGSTTSGDHVVFAGQVGVRDHVHIGRGATLCAMAGVSNDVPDDAVMLGIPATGERDFKVKQAALAKLPELRKEFRRLRQVVEGLSEYVEQQRSRDEGTAEDYSPRDDSRDTDRAA